MPDFVFAWLDCEFGGLDVEQHDITEVAVILTDYRLAELARAEWKVLARTDRVGATGAKISGWTEAEWADAPGIRQVLSEFAGLLPKGKTVVPAGQNVRMDVIFLERAFQACELPYPFDYHVIDLASLFYAWSLSLRQAALTAGLIDGPVPHRALADTELTLDTFRHYIGRLAPRPPSEAPPQDPGPAGD